MSNQKIVKDQNDIDELDITTNQKCHAYLEKNLISVEFLWHYSPLTFPPGSSMCNSIHPSADTPIETIAERLRCKRVRSKRSERCFSGA